MTEQAGPNGVAIRVIRTRRKTISMTLKPDGLEVRAPLWMPEGQIRQFIQSHRDWIQKAWTRQEKRKQEQEKIPGLTEEELRELAEKARAHLPERVAFTHRRSASAMGRSRSNG